MLGKKPQQPADVLASTWQDKQGYMLSCLVPFEPWMQKVLANLSQHVLKSTYA